MPSGLKLVSLILLYNEKKLEFFDFAYVCCGNVNYNKVVGREGRDMRCISY